MTPEFILSQICRYGGDFEVFDDRIEFKKFGVPCYLVLAMEKRYHDLFQCAKKGYRHKPDYWYDLSGALVCAPLDWSNSAKNKNWKPGISAEWKQDKPLENEPLKKQEKRGTTCKKKKDWLSEKMAEVSKKGL